VFPACSGDQPAMAPFWVDVARPPAPPVARVRAGGELDLATAPRLQAELEALLAAGCCQLDLDVQDVTFCDVAGLNMLLGVRVEAVAAGGGLVVRGHCPPLRLMLRVLRLQQLFEPTRRNGESSPRQE
jgi:anti-sigma B factor antagonist